MLLNLLRLLDRIVKSSFLLQLLQVSLILKFLILMAINPQQIYLMLILTQGNMNYSPHLEQLLILHVNIFPLIDLKP